MKGLLSKSLLEQKRSVLSDSVSERKLWTGDGGHLQSHGRFERNRKPFGVGEMFKGILPQK
jgi:hypothetical protein